MKFLVLRRFRILCILENLPVGAFAVLFFSGLSSGVVGRSFTVVARYIYVAVQYIKYALFHVVVVWLQLFHPE